MSLPLILARPIRRAPVFKLIYRQSSSRSSSLGNAAVRGLIFGGTAAGTLTLAGYAVYHVSGAKKFVDTVYPAMVLLGKSQENLAQGAFGQALEYLREAAKIYVSTIPFAGFFVDKAFDAAEDVVATHSAEANAIIIKAYNDISTIIREQGNEHLTRGAVQVVAAARRFWAEIQALGAKAGQLPSERFDLQARVSEASTRASASFESVKSKAIDIFGNKNKDEDVASKTTTKMASVLQGKPVPDEPSVLDQLRSILPHIRDDVKANTSITSALEATKNKAWGIFSKLKPKASGEPTSTNQKDQ